MLSASLRSTVLQQTDYRQAVSAGDRRAVAEQYGATDLIDELKSAGEQATSAARETLDEAHLRQDLAHAYAELGRTTMTLMRQGELADDRLLSPARRISEVEERLTPGTRCERGTGPDW